MSRPASSVSLSVLLYQYLFLVVTCQNFLQNNLESISVINIPRGTNSITVQAGEKVVFQCRSICGSISWTLNGESLNGASYLPYCTICSSSANVLKCNSNIIHHGPVLSNLTRTFDTPGQNFVQCRSKVLGNVFENSSKIHDIYSEVIMVTVTPGMTSTVSHMSSSSIPLMPSVSTNSPYPTSSISSSSVSSTLHDQHSSSNIEVLPTCTTYSIPKLSSSEDCTITSSIFVTTTVFASLEEVSTRYVLSSSVEATSTATQGVPNPTLTTLTSPSIDFTDPVHVSMIAVLSIMIVILVISWTICLLHCLKHRSRKSAYNISRQDSEDSEESKMQTLQIKSVPNPYHNVAISQAPKIFRTVPQHAPNGHYNNSNYTIDTRRSLSNGSESYI